MPLLSIIIPVYENEESLPDTIPTLLKLGDLIPELELVFVNDGSTDQSLQILQEAHREHPKTITVVNLSRNFGSMAAIQAGLRTAKGDCVGVIAADLQDPPELFVDMLKQWEKGVKVVMAVRRNRDDSASSRLFSSLFYKLLRATALKSYPEGGFDFFLLDRTVVNELNQINEPHANLMALIVWLGYPAVMIPYDRRKREKGKSKWTLSKRMKLAIDSLVSFSYVPIRAMSMAGLAFCTFALFYALFLIYDRLINGTQIPGWTAMMVFLSVVSGFILMMLGVLGEYIWRISDTVKRRPNFVIDQIYSNSSSKNLE